MFTDEEKKLIHVVLSKVVGWKTHEAEQAMIAKGIIDKIEAERKEGDE